MSSIDEKKYESKGRDDETKMPKSLADLFS